MEHSKGAQASEGCLRTLILGCLVPGTFPFAARAGKAGLAAIGIGSTLASALSPAVPARQFWGVPRGLGALIECGEEPVERALPMFMWVCVVVCTPREWGAVRLARLKVAA